MHINYSVAISLPEEKKRRNLLLNEKNIDHLHAPFKAKKERG